MCFKILPVFMLILSVFALHAQTNMRTSQVKSSDKREDKFFSVAIHPVKAIVHIPSLSAQIKISDAVTLVPSASYYNIGRRSEGVKGSITGIGAGLHANYYFSEKTFTDSWVGSVGFEFYSASGTVSSKENKGNFSVNSLAPTILFGYHWQWNSGFNIECKLGAAYHVATIKGKVDKSTTFLGSAKGILPTGSLALGFAF